VEHAKYHMACSTGVWYPITALWPETGTNILLQPHQVDVLFILEGVEKLRDPGAAVQSQDPPLLLVETHLGRYIVNEYNRLVP